jgi:hypothetical protein
LSPARVNHPQALHAIHRAHHRAQRRRQPVKDETRVHAGAEQRHLAPLGDLVEAPGDLRVPQPGIRELLAGGNHREASGKRLRQLPFDPVQAAARRVQEHRPRVPLERRAAIVGDGHVGGRRVDHVAELLAHARGIEVDGGDDLQLGLGQRGARDAAPDGSEAHQDNRNRQNHILLAEPIAPDRKAICIPLAMHSTGTAYIPASEISYREKPFSFGAQLPEIAQ